MSRNAKINPVNKKPYCKVCFDAGKPESEYTSHWVRSLPDRSGKTKVTCPTLLSTECRYCYELGHTAKFCPVLEKNNKEKERALKATASERPKQKVPETKKPTSMFDALRDDIDSEEEVKVIKPVENFPVLCAPAKKVEVTLPKIEPEVKTGWAAIAAKPKEDKFMKQIEERSLLKSLPQSVVKPKPEPKVAPWAAKTPVFTKSWADWSDSDEEEDEDDINIPVWTNNAIVDDEDW
jgi:hypothetical protein